MPTVAASLPQAALPARRSTIPAALVAASLGALIVLATGFVPVQAVHNALHDARHAAGFPCH